MLSFILQVLENVVADTSVDTNMQLCNLVTVYCFQREKLFRIVIEDVKETISEKGVHFLPNVVREVIFI